jgi:hypothetical protein
MSSFVRLSCSNRGQTIDKRSHSGIAVCSTGCLSLDSVLLDGIPRGSVMLIQEDWPKSSVNYASLLLKAFLAEGVKNQERCLLISKEADLIESLPEQVEDAVSDAPKDESFKIAWRYKHLHHGMELSSSKPQKFSFDFGKKMPSSLVSKHVVFHKGLTNNLKDLARFAIYGLGSPNFEFEMNDLTIFLQTMKDFNAVGMITIPAYCMDNLIVKKLQHLSDCVINLESASAKQYNAECFLSIVKPFTFIKAFLPSVLSMSIRLEKRRLLVEPFYLPPELDDKTKNDTSMGCASSKLDF